MSATSNPFGLRVVASGSGGIVRPAAYAITSGYASNIFQNQPVKIVPSGTGEGTIAAAAPGDRFIGTFCGVEWTDTDGRRRVSNKWSAGTVGTDIVCYVTLDSTLEYEIQSNAALNISDIGKQFAYTAASGNTVVGVSTQMLDVSSAAANAALRLVNIINGPDNAAGDTYVIARVTISQHQNVADVAAY